MARAALSSAPTFIFSHFPQVKIDLAEDAPLHESAKGLPVLIFSHGNSAIPAMYWSMISNLVQAGHIVVCPEHNDGSAAIVRLEDGSVYTYKSWKSAFAEEADVDKRQGLQHKLCREQLQRRVAEATASMDWILRCASDASSRWYQSVDTDRLAYGGHSFGGATSVVAAEKDVRAKACVCYDCWAEGWGPISPEMLSKGIRRCPTMLAQCEMWTGGEVDKTLQANLLTPWEQKGHPANEMWESKKAGHANFTDFPFLAPRLVTLISQAGTVDGAKCQRESFRKTIEYAC